MKENTDNQTTVKCQNASITKTSNGIAIKLECYNEQKGEEMTCTAYFNAEKGSSVNVKVKKESKFARLYRVTTGDNPNPNRYYKAQQLSKKLIGKEFIVSTKLATHKNGKQYNKVIQIEPSKPKQNEDFYFDGALKPKAA